MKNGFIILTSCLLTLALATGCKEVRRCFREADLKRIEAFADEAKKCRY